MSRPSSPATTRGTCRRGGHDRDRLGVLLSVPIYAEADGALKGLVTTIVRLNALEARLLDWPLVPVTTTERQQAHLLGLDRSAPAEYVLTEAESSIVVSDRRNAALGTSCRAARRPA